MQEERRKLGTRFQDPRERLLIDSVDSAQVKYFNSSPPLDPRSSRRDLRGTRELLPPPPLLMRRVNSLLQAYA